MKIILKNKNRKLELNVKKCNKFAMFKGLMFCKQEKARALMFDFGKSVKTKIHSWFVFFPFIVLWLDKENKVLDMKIIKPFRFVVGINKPFSKIIEIPVNKKYKNIIKFL